ncbi:MAG: hypothetical protein AMJ43_05250 [Coxiella sp. DG_40]|nr:MAG: hypothetical protein AMJ43_05250 [Coxiella sp. DG_40]
MRLNIAFNILAISAGALMPLAFAPFHFYIVSIIAPTLILSLWAYSTPKQALLQGFLFGLGFFTVGVYWVYISVHDYGNAAILLALLITASLIVVLALFPALQGYLLTKFFPENNLRKFLLAFPASWVLFEWLRGWVFTGFPWLFLGYSQISYPLKGFAPIFGIYGVSFGAALSCGAIVSMFTIRKIIPIIFAFVILIFIWLSGGFLAQIDWTKTTGNPIKVSLIQGNISQPAKWQSGSLSLILLHYRNLTNKHWDSKIIIWPEAAIPAFRSQVGNYLEDLEKKAKQHNATIVTGILTENRQTKQYYNSMLAFGKNQSLYLKRHLVPFGEYPPLFPISELIMSTFDIPMSNFSSGAQQQPYFIAGNTPIAPSICYEVAYPSELLSFLPHAQLLINISDDSWFGRSIASAQQLEMARMRSLETGRYHLVCTNTGLTAIVNEKGEILAQAPPYQEFVLNGKVQPMSGSTPWVIFGHYLWFLIVILAIAVAKIEFIQ